MLGTFVRLRLFVLWLAREPGLASHRPPRSHFKASLLDSEVAAVMSPHVSHHSISAPRTRRRGKVVHFQCEQLEERLALALFNIQAPLSFNGLNNNTCVAVADLNK